MAPVEFPPPIYPTLEFEDSESYSTDEEEDTNYKYSREETIAAVSNYYTFLTQMYMEESHVVYPPPGGWPEIINADPATLQYLGKSDEVLALLAHLPYVRCSWENPADIAPGSNVADWPVLITRLSQSLSQGPDASLDEASYIRLATEGTFYRMSPPHVVGLITSRDEAMVLDTKHGVIHWEDCPGRIDFGDRCRVNVDWSELDDGVPEEEAQWRYGATAWTIPDFFEVLKEQFLQLYWLPISFFALRAFVDGDYPGEEGMVAMLRETYQQHGWPDLAVYRKSDCLKAVKKTMAERYPESVCYRGEGP